MPHIRKLAKRYILLVCNRSFSATTPASRPTNMVKPAVVDPAEFARFILTGVSSAAATLSVTWWIRLYEPFEIAVLAGLATGITVSFTLSKWFAFRSNSWRRASSEAPRFLIVYVIGSAVYWTIAVLVERFFLGRGLPNMVAESGGILIGAGTMMLTSYFGHRFFTYRTNSVAVSTQPITETMAGAPANNAGAGTNHS